MNVTVIGAGLAGSEAAWQLAQRGIQVELHEMKPEKMTPAHTTEYFAELCCSNSLRAAGLDPDEYTGFYVNIGLDRLVMMRYGVDDVRLFHSADLRFLRQFH